jgi:predicted nuclease of predicted toxin-antitoxin system
VFVADENVESAIVRRLRDEGHDVIWIAESDPGTTDDSVLAIAQAQARLLITGDTDFGEIVFRQGRVSAGVLLLRLAGLAPEHKASIVSETVRKHLSEMTAAFSVIAPGQLRIRRPGPPEALT